MKMPDCDDYCVRPRRQASDLELVKPIAPIEEDSIDELIDKLAPNASQLVGKKSVK